MHITLCGSCALFLRALVRRMQWYRPPLTCVLACAQGKQKRRLEAEERKWRRMIEALERDVKRLQVERETMPV